MRFWQLLAYDRSSGELVDDERYPLDDETTTPLHKGVDPKDGFQLDVTDANVDVVSRVTRRKLDLSQYRYIFEIWSYPRTVTEPPGPGFVWRGKRPPEEAGYWGAWWHPRTGETLHAHEFQGEFRVEGKSVATIGTAMCYEAPAGINWIRESLEVGGSLSSAILANLSPSSGGVYVCALDAADETRFELAFGLTDDDTSASRAGAMQLLRGSGARLLIAENSVARPGEAAGISKLGTTLVAGDTVLVAHTLAGRTDQEVDDFLSGIPSGYPTNAIATAMERDFTQMESIPYPELVDLVRHTRAIVVRAFDKDSYLIWLADRIAPSDGTS